VKNVVDLPFNERCVIYPANQALIFLKKLFIVQTQRPVYAGLLAQLKEYWSILDLAVAERQLLVLVRKASY